MSAPVGDPLAAMNLEQLGITVEWAEYEGRWGHVVFANDMPVFRSEWVEDALKHAKSVAVGMVVADPGLLQRTQEGQREGEERRQTRREEREEREREAAERGESINNEGEFAPGFEDAQATNAGVNLGGGAGLRENQVNGVPIHRQGGMSGAFLTERVAAGQGVVQAQTTDSGHLTPGMMNIDTARMSEEEVAAMRERRILDPFAPVDHQEPSSVWTGQTARANDPSPQASTGHVRPDADEFQVRGDRLDPRSDELGLQKDNPPTEAVLGTDQTDATYRPDADAEMAAMRGEEAAAAQAEPPKEAIGEGAIDAKARELNRKGSTKVSDQAEAKQAEKEADQAEKARLAREKAQADREKERAQAEKAKAGSTKASDKK